MIERVVKSSWAWHTVMKRSGFSYKVYYKSKDGWTRGRIVTYTDRQNLPLTVLNFILNAGSVETIYIPEKDCYNMKGVKQETYRA